MSTVLIIYLHHFKLFCLDSKSLASSEFQVWIVLDISDSSQCTYTPPVLPVMEEITLHGVTCSYTWPCSLLKIMLTRDHNLKCKLWNCYISACLDGEYSTLGTAICVSINTVNVEISMSLDDYIGMWKPLRGLNIKRLSLNGYYRDLRQLQILCISVGKYSPDLWEVLCDLSINRLSLNGGFNANHNESLSQSISAHTQLETLSIEVGEDSPCLWEALHSLNIKSLSLDGRDGGGVVVNYKESFCQSLLTLTLLDTLYIKVSEDIPGLWEALRGLNIKSLSLDGGKRGLRVKHKTSLSESLFSLTKLETLSVCVNEDSPGLWETIRGLKIKSLSLSGARVCVRVNHNESMCKSLSSLLHLETLSICVNEDSPGLWDAIRGGNIKSLSLGSWMGGLRVNHVESLSESLSSLIQLETLSICVDEDSPDLRKAIHGLHIKNVSLLVEDG
ncbi:hypothetical protein DPMN_140047 [Dreissena polymorpha]|uniref:Uncharacterized protein n=1 Tax=Dreissena polymorpha TaxID=45954 RepID=A0A9D4GAS3_DREPO|nr:hypothetical protein DPMN_140047 [Dreissena polymorpha]